jgi:hypothetical protein
MNTKINNTAMMTDQQRTPLHLAAEWGHVEDCRMLMEAGAVLDARTDQQFTPLHLAAGWGHIEVCGMLMEAGAMLDARTVHQATPLHWAAQKGHAEVCGMLMEAGAVLDARTVRQNTPLHCAAMTGQDSMCIWLTFKGADLAAHTSGGQTPAELAQGAGHASLAAHLHNTDGVHCLHCTGPTLEPRLLWNDTTQQQQGAMLDEMQAQWLARVAEGCAHARVGLTLRGAFGGGLLTGMLVHIMGYVFGGTQTHLQSCISTRRVAAALVVVAGGDVPAVEPQMQELSPKLALVSHALALAVTPAPQPIHGMMGLEAMQQLQATLARLDVAEDAPEGGCEWLHRYCDFLQRRYRLGS